jgi:hypothetical protein
VPGQTIGFVMLPIVGFAGRIKIKCDSLGSNTTYISIFHKDAAKLDAIIIDNNQIILPAGADGFIIHTTTDSREAEVNLSSEVKWYGIRYGVNHKGRGASSIKASVVPQ